MLKKKNAGWGRKMKRARTHDKAPSKHGGEHGLHVIETRDIKIEDVIIGERLRLPQEEEVAKLAESLKTLGQARAITVRKDPEEDGEYRIVAGVALMKAAQMLGWTRVRADIVECDETQALLWEIAENLYRVKLTALEEAEHVQKWVQIISEREAVSRQDVVKSKSGRPEGAITKAARELPIKGETRQARRKAIERNLKIASITPEAKAAAKEARLDKNRDALRKIADEGTPKTQIAKVQEIAKVKAEAHAKRDHVKKSKAKADAPEEKGPRQKHSDDVIFGELKSECPQTFRRTWAEATTKTKRKFLREVLKWEGGKPASKSD